jgi:5'-methylthioadenosine phosphorylase
MAKRPVVGVVGGSGLYAMEGIEDATWRKVDSPFGAPSDEILFGTIDGVDVRFLPRHGRGHRVSPTTINYRANIDALKRAGCTDVVSVSAVGSLREDLAPGTFVIVDQFVDRTFAREKTFFGTGCVAHVSVAKPVCGRVGDALEKCAKEQGIAAVRGGTYLVMEGPQFSSEAESHLYRSWGMHVIGMTNMPEAKLAREAELCYATVAMVTDYDCWRTGHEHVTVDDVVRVLMANADKARGLVRAVVPALAQRPEACEKGCDRALEYAIMTSPEARDPELVAKLSAVAGRVLTKA